MAVEHEVQRPIGADFAGAEMLLGFGQHAHGGGNLVDCQLRPEVFGPVR